MTVVKANSKRKGNDAAATSRSEKTRRQDHDLHLDPDLDLDLSSDIKGIISALHQIREKAQKDGQKKNEETIGSVASEVKAMLDEAKTKIERERYPYKVRKGSELRVKRELVRNARVTPKQTFVKALSKSSKEYETSLKSEHGKFQAAHEKFCKDRATHMQALKDIFSKFENEKEKMFARYEQQRKKERALISDLEIACAEKIAAAEDSLKKKKQDDKSFSILRKSLGSFFDSASDEDFGSDE